MVKFPFKPDLTAEEKAKILIENMTLREKVGQLAGTVFVDLETAKKEIRENLLGACVPLMYANNPLELVEFVNSLQKFAVEETRLGIPLLIYMDAIHGHAFVKGATVFPHNLASAATWDSDLITEVASITAKEAKATGIHLNFSPICDIARDPRWGRTFETFGESPYLCSVMAAAKVRGYQGNLKKGIDGEHVVATAKHFPAYSNPERGEDASPVDISEYTLRTIHLPAFKAAIKAGALAIMPCYNEINGKPVHGSKKYLTDLLRKELGFKGIIVSDANGTEMLYTHHHTAKTYEESIKQGVTAGIDIEIFGGGKHASTLLKLIENRKISEELINEKVRRILELKIRLGLFENLYVDQKRASELLGCKKHMEVALEAARKCITLLKNENNLLPLSKDVGTILVTGPNANNVENQLGGWSNTLPPYPPAVTILDGIKAKVSSKSKVLYCEGSSIIESGNLKEVGDLAESSDVALVVIGEPAYIHEFWTLADLQRLMGANPTMTEEEMRKHLFNRLYQFPCRTLLDLPEAQLNLVRKVHETGTPTIVVLVTGRPLVISWIAENIPAIIMSYIPGSEGGKAVADVLFGDYNPGGKLPISIPRSIGQLPVWHNYKPHPFLEMHPPAYMPLFEFGYGLSYTKFEYSNLEIAPVKVDPSGMVHVKVTVRNVGDREGDEVIQLYVNDVYSSSVIPIKELKGFKRITLKPGENKRVNFTLLMEDLGIFQEDGRFVTEPGIFEVMVGGLKSIFEVV